MLRNVELDVSVSHSTFRKQKKNILDLISVKSKIPFLVKQITTLQYLLIIFR